MGFKSLYDLINSFTILFFQAKGFKNKYIFLSYTFQNVRNRVLNRLLNHEDIYIEFKNANVWFGASAGELSSIIEIFVRKDYEMDPNFIPAEDETVFDIGANIGLYSIRQAKRLKNGKVFCFEPNPHAFKRLQKNINANNLNNIIAFNNAVYSENCEVKLSPNVNSTESHLVQDMVSIPGTISKVQAVALDDLVREYGIKKIDLMKIDVEGSEVEVLKGAHNSLRFTKKIVLECHSEVLKNQVVSILVSNGFEKTLEIKGKPIYSLYFENRHYMSC